MAHSKLYVRLMNSREWHELRTQVIREHPICQRCESVGHITASRCVHHVIPIESARTEAEARDRCLSRNNCIALCFQCHADIHKAERSHTKAVIAERTQQRLSTWADGLRQRLSQPKPPDPED